MADYEVGRGPSLKRLTLKEIPPEERPRERLLQHGADTLTDAELLAIIIRDGTRQESALDLARRLLHEHRSLRELADVPLADLCKVRGIGPARAAQIKAALAIASRLAAQRLERGRSFTGSRSVFEHFHLRLRGERQECIYCLLLDAKNRVMREVAVSRGGLTTSLAHPREILRTAIAEAANAIILVHNHPSGDPTPSADDIHLTRRVKQAAELAGIRLLDHVIVADEGYASLADRGQL